MSKENPADDLGGGPTRPSTPRLTNLGKVTRRRSKSRAQKSPIRTSGRKQTLTRREADGTCIV
jgi:hypothetical protein